MSYKMLRVRAKAGVLVMDPVAMDANVHRYIGQKPKLVPPTDPVGRADFYEPIAEGVSVPEHGHTKEAVKRGELEPCDEWTATRCRVDWKPAKTPARV